MFDLLNSKLVSNASFKYIYQIDDASNNFVSVILANNINECIEALKQTIINSYTHHPFIELSGMRMDVDDCSDIKMHEILIRVNEKDKKFLAFQYEN